MSQISKLILYCQKLSAWSNKKKRFKIKYLTE